MVNLSDLTLEQLLRVVAIKVELNNLNTELAEITGDRSVPIAEPVVKGRGMSAAGRARIGAAARARWAKLRGKKGEAATAKPSASGKRKYSTAGRAALAAAAKARWAKAKAAGQSSL